MRASKSWLLTLLPGLLILVSVLCEALLQDQVLLLQVLDSHALKDALAFVQSPVLSAALAKTDVSVIISTAHYQSADKDVKESLSKIKTLTVRHYSPHVAPLPDVSIGKKVKTEERVSYVLDGLNSTMSSPGWGTILSLAFRKGSTPHPLPSFANFFNIKAKGEAADIVLLGKTRRLTSVSDWHDLQVLVVRNKESTRKWLSTFQEQYLHHAQGRAAFALLEPRPALLESLVRLRATLSPTFFSKGQICRQHTVSGGAAMFEGQPTSLDHCLQHASFLSIECADVGQVGDSGGGSLSPCHVLDEPQAWRARIDRNVVSTYEQRSPFIKADKWSSHLHEGIWAGSLRFIHPHDDKTPRKFCWETDAALDATLTGSTSGAGVGGDGTKAGILPWKQWRPDTPPGNPALDNAAIGSAGTFSGPANPSLRRKEPGKEQMAQSRIYRGFNESSLFVHDRTRWELPADKRLKILVMTGSQASGNALEAKLHLQLAKMMYCRRHGYSFLHSLSNQFVAFFPADLYADIRAEMSHTAYFKGLMSKTLMVADALLQHPDHAWVVWTDDDVYINPGWLYLPLEAFLGDVPEDKVYVSANYRSTFTNVFAVRNTEAGRRLVYDWIAVAMSGHVQCHGFDQAAIGTLLLTRILGRMEPFPFNHTCTWSDAGFTGCNAKGDWSCDFKVEASLYRAGFKTRAADFFGQKISSFTKGCANHLVADFHVVAETKDRPRWQCGHCTRLYEIESSGHWDGPLGGGNDLLRRSAVNGWFFNHKADFLFYEAWLDPSNCDYAPDVIPLCSDVASGNASSSSSSGALAMMPREPRGVGVGRQHHHQTLSLLPLIDGYVFDTDRGSYCRSADAATLAQQAAKTYMKDYPAIIAAARAGYSDKSWWDKYKAFSGGEGRDSCWPRDPADKDKCENGWGSDGQKSRRRSIGEDEDHIFERSQDFCSAECRQVKGRYGLASMDCRADADIAAEKERKINQE